MLVGWLVGWLLVGWLKKKKKHYIASKHYKNKKDTQIEKIMACKGGLIATLWRVGWIDLWIFRDKKYAYALIQNVIYISFPNLS